MKPTVVWDVLAVLGLALVTAGSFWVYQPLGPLVLGASLIILGIWGAKKCS